MRERNGPEGSPRLRRVMKLRGTFLANLICLDGLLSETQADLAFRVRRGCNRRRMIKSRPFRFRDPFPAFVRILASAGVLLPIAAGAADDVLRFTPSRERWTVQSEALVETSGVAPSPGDGNFIWALNDGGNAPELHLLNPTGGDQGQVAVLGVANIDWEDLDSFVLDGRSYLLIADTGDNASRRKSGVLNIVPEPDIRSGRADGVITPAWSILFRYPDGPRDCEAAAVDAREKKILLISKRTTPPVLYELPLIPPPADGPIVARRLGEVALPQTVVPAIPYANQPTGLTISPDGTRAALLTYLRVLLYPRQKGESWAEAFHREPVVLKAHGLEQAEAIAFSTNGKVIHVLSEGKRQPIVSYEGM